MNGWDFCDAGQDFIISGRDFRGWCFHGDKPSFYHEELRLPWWEVEILLWMATTLKGLKILSPCHKQQTIITILASTRPKRLTKEWKNITFIFWPTFFTSPFDFMCQFHFHLYSQILHHFDFVSHSISTSSWFHFYFYLISEYGLELYGVLGPIKLS